MLTSPHFVCKTERISINSENITPFRLEKIYQENQEYLEGLAFFELLTFIAFIYFAEENVDYAVIEVGLGGLKDVTNVITPVLSVITNLAYDHVEVLGPTLADIAFNKAGIIKPRVPVVLGKKAQHEECYKAAALNQSKVYEVPSADDDYLKENKCISDLSLKVLGISPLDQIFTLPARFEVHENYIFDMAHNEDGILALKRKIQKDFPNKEVIALWNMSTTKSIETCLNILQSFCTEVYFFPNDFSWLLSKEEAKLLGLKEYQGESSDLILVCGSIYFLAEAKDKLLNQKQWH